MHRLILYIFISIFSLGVYAQNDKATYKKFDKALKLIDTKYVEKVNTEELVTKAVQAMIKELDPHSKYLSPEELKKNKEQLNGSFAGVGIHYQILDDTLIVLNTIIGGPSYKAGIKAGDKILKIDGEDAVGENVNNKFFSKKLRGKKGSKLSLTVRRHSNSKIETVTFERGSIALNTLQVSYKIDNKTGFVRIKNFSRTTNYEFQLAMMQLQMEGMKNIIIDLRDNPGGLMMASIRLADDFIKDGKLIVYTQGANMKRTEYTSHSGGVMESGKLVVLMDDNSASAAEIFAGAIQDWDRGIIMGRRSFGKGLVGRNYTLPDASAIRLITGRYYTPSGRCIQKEYTKGDKLNYDKDILHRYESGELYSADSVHFADSLKYYTDGKRLVYGGGAIMPDIFIPLDTTYNIDFIKQLNKHGIITYFSGLYFDKHLEKLNKRYSNYATFSANFELDDKSYNDILAYALEKHELKPSKDNIDKSKHYIKYQIKAILARILFENGSYFKESNKEDRMVIEALKTINSKKDFKKNGIHD